MGSNKHSIFNTGQINILKLDVADRTLSTGPGLDTNTILAVDTGTVLDSDVLDNVSFATLTKRTDTETMAVSTSNISESNIRDV